MPSTGRIVDMRARHANRLHGSMPVQRAAADASFAYDTAVVGLGYVGLPTALALQDSGLRVLGLDVSDARIADIRTGRADLLDADHQRLASALAAGPGAFVLSSEAGPLPEAETVLVCVPTPIDEHLAPDLTALRAACRTAVEHAVPGQTLVLTSTTYVGCTRDLLVGPLRERGFEVGADIFVAFAPERIDPGNDRHTQQQVPRVVGGVTSECVKRAAALLEHCAGSVHAVSSVEAAEMTKLYENTFRAVNISMANEFADISRGLGLDITEVITAAATKPYGFMPFFPGPGVGGHCIPCDPHYLLWQLRGDRVTSPLIETAMTLVAGRPTKVVQRAVEVLAEREMCIVGARVLIRGVAYKPGVADVRESPALEIIERLRRAGARVWFTDELVDTVRVGGVDLTSVLAPEATDWDLVIVHTVHPGSDVSWLSDVPAVLDTTYRLGELTHRSVL
ncbi:nucleotide sugar dehydrogenase [Krasilnikovia sp. M28-CT-15]